MKTVSKSVLKSKMLGIFREIEKTGEELIITDHHIPTLKITPLQKKSNVKELFQNMQGKIRYTNDVWESDPSEWGDLG